MGDNAQAVLGFLKARGFKPAVVDYKRRVFKDGVQVKLNFFRSIRGRGEVLVEPYFVDDKTANYERETQRIHDALKRGPFDVKFNEYGPSGGIVIVRARQ